MQLAIKESPFTRTYASDLREYPRRTRELRSKGCTALRVTAGVRTIATPSAVLEPGSLGAYPLDYTGYAG